MLKRIPIFLICAYVISITIFVFGCSQSKGPGAGLRLGELVPAGAAIVTLAEVLAKPVYYDGKKIVLQGSIVSQCPSLCFFSFQDGAHTITLYPQGFTLPKLKQGVPITVYCEVLSGEGQVVLAILGLETE